MGNPADQAMDAHRREAAVEDVLFLMEWGASLEEAARRVGVSVSMVEKNMQRHPER